MEEVFETGKALYFSVEDGETLLFGDIGFGFWGFNIFNGGLPFGFLFILLMVLFFGFVGAGETEIGGVILVFDLMNVFVSVFDFAVDMVL